MPIFDNHLHLRRDGACIEAVREFERAGGTHLVLCQLPMVQRVIEERSYLPCYEETLSLAEEAMQATDVTVFVTVGPYPADNLRLRDRFGRDAAMDLMRRGMEQAQQLCLDGDVIAIGEIGRPHFDVDDEAWKDSNELLRYGMELAANAGVPVVLHTESMGPDGFAELAGMADEAGLAREKVVKHFSPPLIQPDENHGLMPSVLANAEALRVALRKGHRFVMETDYIDDPARPGAVLGPKTVPRRTMQLLEEGVMSDEVALAVHKKNPEWIYGITVD
ncbi:MAG: TatD family hydrolase [Thermoplasmatota archaeon]